MGSKQKNTPGALLILLAGVVWGSMGIFVRSLNAFGFGSVQIVCLRLTVTFGVLVTLCALGVLRRVVRVLRSYDFLRLLPVQAFVFFHGVLLSLRLSSPA